MDPISIIKYLTMAMDLVPRIVSAGHDIAAYVGNVQGVVKTAQDTDTAIPDAAWDELKAVREGLQARLHSA